jgi:polar amino acid transport system substrate-binding protein
VNAGPLPRDHWINDPQRGGGRLLGEACHFIDFAVFLCGERVRRVFAAGLRAGDEGAEAENVAITLQMSGGSLATITYHANGARALPKEWIEASWEGRTLQIDDFAAATLHDGRRRTRLRLAAKGRGYREEVRAFLAAARAGAPAPIPDEELFHVTEATLAVPLSLRRGEPVALPEPAGYAKT